MTREIVCVYQDCPLCGNKGKKLSKIVADKKIALRKVSFASDEGKDLIAEAVFKKGIGTMPFFTDGENFSVRIEDLLPKPARKKKTVKKVEEVGDGVDN